MNQKSVLDEDKNLKARVESMTAQAKAEALDQASEAIGFLRELGLRSRRGEGSDRRRGRRTTPLPAALARRLFPRHDGRLREARAAVANPESSLTIAMVVMKGSEHLASDKIVMRLGGIYALEGVMNTSEQYHQPVLEALCAFVRENTIGK